MVERLDPDSIGMADERPGDRERFIEHDFRIRSGLCPNGHGLMRTVSWGQECPSCRFTCNTLPELTRQ